MFFVVVEDAIKLEITIPKYGKTKYAVKDFY